MFKNTKVTILLFLGIIILFGLGVFAINQMQMLNKAHSTFANYYAFRGCVQLLKKTETYGVCKTDQGKIIKIVKYNQKWYLDGDLPVCWEQFCF